MVSDPVSFGLYALRARATDFVVKLSDSVVYLTLEASVRASAHRLANRFVYSIEPVLLLLCHSEHYLRRATEIRSPSVKKWSRTHSVRCFLLSLRQFSYL